MPIMCRHCTLSSMRVRNHAGFDVSRRFLAASCAQQGQGKFFVLYPQNISVQSRHMFFSPSAAMLAFVSPFLQNWFIIPSQIKSAVSTLPGRNLLLRPSLAKRPSVSSVARRGLSEVLSGSLLPLRPSCAAKTMLTSSFSGHFSGSSFFFTQVSSFLDRGYCLCPRCCENSWLLSGSANNVRRSINHSMNPSREKSTM